MDGVLLFLVTAETISSWFRRIDEGDAGLVHSFYLVNKFPDGARYRVPRSGCGRPLAPLASLSVAASTVTAAARSHMTHRLGTGVYAAQRADLIAGTLIGIWRHPEARCFAERE